MAYPQGVRHQYLGKSQVS